MLKQPGARKKYLLLAPANRVKQASDGPGAKNIPSVESTTVASLVSSGAALAVAQQNLLSPLSISLIDNGPMPVYT